MASGDYGRKAVFLAGLAAIVIGALAAAGLIGLLGGSYPYQAHLLLDLVIAIGSIHLLSVCAGLWFVDREARWVLLAIVFAIASLFAIRGLVRLRTAFLAGAGRVTALSP